MIDDITLESVAAEVRLLHDDPRSKETYLFVEGETDARFFSNYIVQGNCQIRYLKGKDQVLQLVSLLEKDGVTGFLAIVDADFCHVENNKPSSANICFTDFHDLEIMMITSPALDKILRENLPSSKLKVVDGFPKGIRYSALNAAFHIGRIRWASHKYHLNISFYANAEKTEYLAWDVAITIDKKGISVDNLKLMDVVCPSVSLRQKVRDRLSTDTHIKSCDMRQFCNGHDVSYVIFVLLKTYGRAKDVEHLEIKDVEKALRLAYETKYFMETDLYRQIVDWQQENGRMILSM